MQPFQGLSETAATVEHGLPDRYIPSADLGGWRGLKQDLLPMMALLGAVFGWVFALLVVLVVAVVLLVR